MRRGDEQNRAWTYYELGRAYNNSLTPNQYRLVNTNIEFFAGNQWLHIPETEAMSRLARPTFNIIKRIASLFVASLTSSAATVSFPVPSPDEVPMLISPSLIVLVPVLVLLPFQVIFPCPSFTKLAFDVILIVVVQLSSLPTCQVLAPTLAPLLKVQLPPRAPVPVTFPMR